MQSPVLYAAWFDTKGSPRSSAGTTIRSAAIAMA